MKRPDPKTWLAQINAVRAGVLRLVVPAGDQPSQAELENLAEHAREFAQRVGRVKEWRLAGRTPPGEPPEYEQRSLRSLLAEAAGFWDAEPPDRLVAALLERLAQEISAGVDPQAPEYQARDTADAAGAAILGAVEVERFVSLMRAGRAEEWVSGRALAELGKWVAPIEGPAWEDALAMTAMGKALALARAGSERRKNAVAGGGSASRSDTDGHSDVEP